MKNFVMGILIGASVFVVAAIFAQSTNRVGPVDDYNITAYPLYGSLAIQHDTNPLANPGMIRPNVDAAVTAACWGNTVAQAITMNLVAGEFFPCVVGYLKDTGTDAVTIHIFY